MNDNVVVEGTTAVTPYKEKKEVMIRDNYDFWLDFKSFDEAVKRAQYLAASGLIPQRFQGQKNVGTVLQALSMAKRLNADVLAVFQNVYEVYGQVGLSGKFIHALIDNCGRYKPLEFVFKHDDNGNVISCTAKTIDLRFNRPLEMTVTWKEVTAAGWNRDKKDKNGRPLASPWNIYRQMMFVYRVVSHFAKTYAPDIILGMQSIEELEDLERVETKTPTIRPAKVLTVKDVEEKAIPQTPTVEHDESDYYYEDQPQEPHEFTPPPLHRNKPYIDEPDFVPDEPVNIEPEQEGVSCWWDDMKHWQYRKPIDFYLLVMIGFGVAFRFHTVKTFDPATNETEEIELMEVDQKKYQQLSLDNPFAICTLSDANTETYERIKRKFVNYCGFDENVFVDFENS